MIITGEGGVKKLLKLMWLSLQGLHICQSELDDESEPEEYEEETV